MIIFFHGADTFRSQEKLQELKLRFLNKVENAQDSLSYISKEDMSLQNINESLNINSLFAPKKLVIIKELFTHKDPKLFEGILNFLQTKKLSESQDITVIFWEENLSKLNQDQKKLFNFLAQQKFSQEFKPLTQSQLITWIKNRFSQANKQINFKNIQTLVNYTSGNLWHLDQEIKKIIAFSDTEEITDETINSLMQTTVDDNIFNLTDAISQKHTSKALQLLEQQFFAGANPEYILTMLTRQFKILLQVKDKKNKQGNLQDLNLHPFVLKKTSQQIKNFKLSELKHLLTKILKLDYLYKKGEIDLKTELNLLLINQD